jgi:hypothetical protein
MDTTTVLRMIAGVVTVILVGMIIARRKRTAVNKRLSTRR